MKRRRTQAQEAASMRNWGIRNLRALYAQAYQLSDVRRRAVQALIDDELAARGAEREAVRSGRWEAELARWRAEQAALNTSADESKEARL